MELVCIQGGHMAVGWWVMNGTMSLLTVPHPQGYMCLVLHTYYPAPITLTSAIPRTILLHRVRWSSPRVPSTGPGHWIAIDTLGGEKRVQGRLPRFLRCRS